MVIVADSPRDVSESSRSALMWMSIESGVSTFGRQHLGVWTIGGCEMDDVSNDPLFACISLPFLGACYRIMLLDRYLQKHQLKTKPKLETQCRTQEQVRKKK